MPTLVKRNEAYDPDQPRDDDGRWTDTGGGGGDASETDTNSNGGSNNETGGRSAQNKTATVKTSKDGTGKWDTEDDGTTSYAGVHESQYEGWVKDPRPFQSAIAGTIKEGDPTGTTVKDRPMTKEDVAAVKAGAAAMVAAAKANYTTDSLFRGESYLNEAEVDKIYAVGKKVAYRGLTSFSPEEHLARHYTIITWDFMGTDSTGERPAGVLLRIKKGAQGIQIAPNRKDGKTKAEDGPFAAEFIAPPDVQYRVTKITRTKIEMYPKRKYDHTHTIIDLEPVEKPTGKRVKLKRNAIGV